MKSFVTRILAKVRGPKSADPETVSIDQKSEDQSPGMRINPLAVAQLGGQRGFSLTPMTELPVIDNPFTPAPLPGHFKLSPVTEPPVLAQDDSPEGSFSLSLVDSDNPYSTIGGFTNFNEGIGFFGYAYLAQLSQRPEYRKIVETIATEMTREWIEFVYQGDEGGRTQATDKIKDIEEVFDKWKVKEAFRHALECDGFFGRGQIFIDIDASDDPDESDEELQTILMLDRRKIRPGKVRGVKVVEPIWSYPNEYNTTDPLAKDFYKPKSWLIMNKRVHNSRLLTIVSRPVPDLLKPAYAFGGLSLCQMAKPYVDNWLRTRQSVSDLLHSFTVWGIKTDLNSLLQGGDAEQLINRADAFNKCRDNRGLMMIQNGKEGEGEDFFNISVPLGTLDALQAQSQEQLASISSIPMVKLLGNTPSGLNASSDGEIRVFYDTVNADQERMLRNPLETLLKVAQLHLFGEIDDNINFEFKELWQQDEGEQAVARKADADIDNGYIESGVLSAVEVRQKLAADKNSPYSSIDVMATPDDPRMLEAMTDIASAAVTQPDMHAHVHQPGSEAPIPGAGAAGGMGGGEQHAAGGGGAGAQFSGGAQSQGGGFTGTSKASSSSRASKFNSSSNSDKTKGFGATDQKFVDIRMAADGKLEGLLAGDKDRWITIHPPNGNKEDPGRPIKIDDGTGEVESGPLAGQNLNQPGGLHPPGKPEGAEGKSEASAPKRKTGVEKIADFTKSVQQRQKEPPKEADPVKPATPAAQEKSAGQKLWDNPDDGNHAWLTQGKIHIAENPNATMQQKLAAVKSQAMIDFLDQYQDGLQKVKYFPDGSMGGIAKSGKLLYADSEDEFIIEAKQELGHYEAPAAKKEPSGQELYDTLMTGSQDEFGQAFKDHPWLKSQNEGGITTEVFKNGVGLPGIAAVKQFSPKFVQFLDGNYKAINKVSYNEANGDIAILDKAGGVSIGSENQAMAWFAMNKDKATEAAKVEQANKDNPVDYGEPNYNEEPSSYAGAVKLANSPKEAQRSVREKIKDPDKLNSTEAVHLTKELWNGNSEHLSQKAVSALQAYTGSSYGPINAFLRTGKDEINGSSDMPSYYEETYQGLIEAFENDAAVLTEEFSVYRCWGHGMNSIFGPLEEMVGRTFMDKGFVSTTLSPQHAKDRAGSNGVYFKVKLPKGARALALAKISNFDDEAEVLVKHGSKFKVTNMVKEAHGYGERTLIEAEYVLDE